MSKTYCLRQVQKLPISTEEAWNFFSNPQNLVKITPATLDFKILTDITTNEIYAGQVITYRVKLMFGIAVKWISEITVIQKHELFDDEQRKGPYKMWHHEHHFKAIDGGTEMTDIITYQLPFGILGSIALPIVKSQLQNIFTYRRSKIEELFPNG
jgi:ligand-binding SRPBCC domain-containing protein